MAQIQRKRKKGKRKGKVILTQRARLVEKNDKTRVARRDTTPKRKAPFIINDNGLNMRIKIKRN